MPLPRYRLNKLRLYRLLAERNQSVRDFARAHGFNVGTVRKWASGDMAALPGPRSRRRLLEATGLAMGDLFEEVQPD